MRLSFGCVADVTVDCAVPGTSTGGGQDGGGSADCAKLLTYASDAWVCTAFPMDGVLRDTLLCSLISVACTLPLITWLEFLFISQNESHTRGATGIRWLSATGLIKVYGGKDGWRYNTRKVNPKELEVATAVSVKMLMLEKMEKHMDQVSNLLLCRKGCKGKGKKAEARINTDDMKGEDVEKAKERAEEFNLFQGL